MLSPSEDFLFVICFNSLTGAPLEFFEGGLELIQLIQAPLKGASEGASSPGGLRRAIYSA